MSQDSSPGPPHSIFPTFTLHLVLLLSKGIALPHPERPFAGPLFLPWTLHCCATEASSSVPAAPCPHCPWPQHLAQGFTPTSLQPPPQDFLVAPLALPPASPSTCDVVDLAFLETVIHLGFWSTTSSCFLSPLPHSPTASLHISQGLILTPAFPHRVSFEVSPFPFHLSCPRDPDIFTCSVIFSPVFQFHFTTPD